MRHKTYNNIAIGNHLQYYINKRAEMRRIHKFFFVSYMVVISYLLTLPVFAMHIMEGFLPIEWSIFWYLVSLPFVLLGLNSIKKIMQNNPKLKVLLAISGAYTFVLSALKIPSVTGSCSHPTGIGLGSILFGPLPMVVLGSIVLVFQTLLLAHGGITTLGANVFSMAIVGSFTSYFIYKSMTKLNAPMWLSIFLSACLGDLSTYLTTSLQLSIAFPAEIGGFTLSLIKFTSIFGLTQIPLAISEGILTVIIINILTSYNSNELKELNVIKEGV